jgi:hypothetical protein
MIGFWGTYTLMDFAPVKLHLSEREARAVRKSLCLAYRDSRLTLEERAIAEAAVSVLAEAIWKKARAELHIPATDTQEDA